MQRSSCEGMAGIDMYTAYVHIGIPIYISWHRERNKLNSYFPSRCFATHLPHCEISFVLQKERRPAFVSSRRLPGLWLFRFDLPIGTSYHTTPQNPTTTTVSRLRSGVAHRSAATGVSASAPLGKDGPGIQVPTVLEHPRPGMNAP